MQPVCIFQPLLPSSQPSRLTTQSSTSLAVLIVSGVNETLTTVPTQLGFDPIPLHSDACFAIGLNRGLNLRFVRTFMLQKFKDGKQHLT